MSNLQVNTTIVLSYEPGTCVWWAEYKHHIVDGTMSGMCAGAELLNAPFVAIARLLQRCQVCGFANTNRSGAASYPEAPHYCSAKCERQEISIT